MTSKTEYREPPYNEEHNWQARIDDLRIENAKLAEERDQAYSERNHLVALLAQFFPSGIAKTDIPGWDPEWHNCVYIDLRGGQASWHIHDSEMYLFKDLPPYTKEWDGHTTEEKYARIRNLIEFPEHGKGEG